MSTKKILVKNSSLKPKYRYQLIVKLKVNKYYEEFFHYTLFYISFQFFSFGSLIFAFILSIIYIFFVILLVIYFIL